MRLPSTSVLANVVGGSVFGVGMASAGYCPGTIVAEAGEGRLDAWMAGLSGLVVGAIVFGLLQRTIERCGWPSRSRWDVGAGLDCYPFCSGFPYTVLTC
jgi:uncharacterized membrane protein YedE/YeeE